MMARTCQLFTAATLLFALPAQAQVATPVSGSCPAWANAIVFTRDDPVTGYDIFVVQPDGSGLIHLDNNPGRMDRAPQWSPDHCHIVYTAKVEHEDEAIRMINPDGSGMVTLIGGGDNDRDWNPSLSPDGRWVAYARAPRLPDRHLGEDDLWIAPVDGSVAPRQITGFPGDEHWVQWSPDGAWILFKAEFAGNSDVWLVNPEGTEFVQLTDARVGEGPAAWSPDGRTIAYVSGGPTTEIYLMDRDGANPRQLSHFGRSLPAGPHFLAFSPDGTRLAVSLTAPSGAYDRDLYILSLQDGSLTNLTALFSGQVGDGADDTWVDW